MEINKDAVRKMAELSRVRLSEDEVARLEKEFAGIFAYFQSIQDVGKESGRSLYVSGGKGAPRADEQIARPKDEPDKIVENFARKDGRLLVAPKSLG